MWRQLLLANKDDTVMLNSFFVSTCSMPLIFVLSLLLLPTNHRNYLPLIFD